MKNFFTLVSSACIFSIVPSCGGGDSLRFPGLLYHRMAALLLLFHLHSLSDNCATVSTELSCCFTYTAHPIIAPPFPQS